MVTTQKYSENLRVTLLNARQVYNSMKLRFLFPLLFLGLFLFYVGIYLYFLWRSSAFFLANTNIDLENADVRINGHPNVT